mmetsp:Transcript_11730/g.28105  ORF Transcript_11730/g.28105 Transcript_11730/m.28105 type:complete len:479 (-) Transcript_11730:69-1505(-)
MPPSSATKKRTPSSAAKSKKASSSSSSPPSKSVRLEVAESDPAKNPIVVSFPGGLPQAIASDNNANSTAVPKFYWQRLNEKSKSGRRVVGNDRHCTFEAHAKGLAYDDRRTKLCVGVYDKKRGVVTIHETASKGTVFSLRQSVPSYNQNGGGHVESARGDLTKRTQVFEDFGSSKKRKVLKSQAANQVDIDNVVGAGEGSAIVQNMMSGKGMSKSNKEAIEESRRENADSPGQRQTATERALQEARKKLLPEYDENAVEAHKVYDPKNMLGEDAWTRVHKKVYAIVNKNQEDKDELIDAMVDAIHEKDRVDFIIRSIQKINPSAKDSTRRFTCALLTHYMIRFYRENQRRRSFKGPDMSKSFHYGVPIEVAEKCFDQFATTSTGPNGKTQYIMTKPDKERTIVHILLMFMHVQNSGEMKIVDLKRVADELKLPFQDCGQLLSYAGCKITKKKDTIIATLTTPLIFPSMKKGGGPKGRG